MFRVAAGVSFGMLRDFAEFERELIRTVPVKTERAMEQGVKLGRMPKPTDHQKREVGRIYNVSGWTIPRLMG